MAVSILAHAVWFWCSPPLSQPGPASAPVVIGWVQLPQQAVAPAAPSVAKPLTPKPVAATPAGPRRDAPVLPSKRPPPEPSPPASVAPATAPDAATAVAGVLPPADGGGTNPSSPALAATAASAGAAAGMPVAPATGGALVEAVPLDGDNPPPRYPRLARQRGWEGLVSLQVRVNALGEVEDVWVEGSSGHGVLDQAALTAVKGWRFRPARQGVRAISGVARVPIEFRLRGG